MSTTSLEKTNLEAHVDLCAERYKQLDLRLCHFQDFSVPNSNSLLGKFLLNRDGFKSNEKNKIKLFKNLQRSNWN